MIDISLSEKPVDIEQYESFNEQLPCLFLGFAIKNEYDNQRLQINGDYQPKRRLFVFKNRKQRNEKDVDAEYNILPLYGLFLDLNDRGKLLANTLINEENNNNLDIVRYEKILFEYSLSCYESYSYFNERIYPVDINHLKELTYTNNISKDKKILQHLLLLDDYKFNFQKFGSFKLLILT